MRTIAISLLALTLTVPAADAQKVDQVALRKAARFPSIWVQMGFGIGRDGFVFSHLQSSEEPKEKIKTILAEMKGDASDAERYYRLGCLYHEKDKELWTKAFEKSATLYRERVAAAPQNGALYTSLGSTLWELHRIKEAEACLRKGIELAPRDWRGWSELGQFLNERAFDGLPIKKNAQAADVKTFRVENLLAEGTDLFARNPTDDEIKNAERLLASAQSCFDKGVEVAPRETKAYLDRASAAGTVNLLKFHLSRAQGQKPIFRRSDEAFLTPAILADMEKAAELSPGDPHAAAIYAFMTLASLVPKIKNNPNPSQEELKDVEDRGKAIFDLTEKRLLDIAAAKDKRTLARTTETLGLFYTLFGMYDKSPEAAERWLRRAVDMNTASDFAWEILIGEATKRDSFDEAAALCERRLKKVESVKFRNWLAKIRAWQDDWRTAETHLRTALKADPAHVPSQLGLAVVMIRRGDAASLKQASAELDQAEKLLAKSADPALQNDSLALRAIVFALGGDTDRARKLLRQVLDNDEKHEIAKSVHAILFPPPPAPPPLSLPPIGDR